jgi:hypothetical protein
MLQSTLINCPVDGRVLITVEVQQFKGENVVMVERIFQDQNYRRRANWYSVKQTIALGNLLSAIQLPVTRENGQPDI